MKKAEAALQAPHLGVGGAQHHVVDLVGGVARHEQQRGHAQRRRDLVLQVLAVADDVLRRGRRGAGAELLVLGQRQQVGVERVAGRAVALLLERPRVDGAGAADLRGQLLQPAAVGVVDALRHKISGAVGQEHVEIVERHGGGVRRWRAAAVAAPAVISVARAFLTWSSTAAAFIARVLLELGQQRHDYGGGRAVEVGRRRRRRLASATPRPTAYTDCISTWTRCSGSTRHWKAESAIRRTMGRHGALVVGGLNHVGHEALHANTVEDIAERFEIGALVLEAKLLRQLQGLAVQQERQVGLGQQPVHDAPTGPYHWDRCGRRPKRDLAARRRWPRHGRHRAWLRAPRGQANMAAVASRSPQRRSIWRPSRSRKPTRRALRALRGGPMLRCQSRSACRGWWGSRGIRTLRWGRPLCPDWVRDAKAYSQADWQAVRQQTCRTCGYSAACWAFAPQPTAGGSRRSGDPMYRPPPSLH